MSNKTFTKKIKYIEVNDVEALYVHSVAVWGVLKGSCLIPKPISYTKESICFEYLELPSSVEELILNKNESLSSALYQAGRVLAKLHTSGSSKLLHSDFAPHNLFFSEGNLSVIDSNPPEILGSHMSLMYGNAELDYFFFLMSLPSCFGVKKSIFDMKFIKSCQRDFIAGYNSISNINMSYWYVFRVARNMLSFRVKAGHGTLKSIVHLLIVMIFILG
ncbi:MULTISPECIES: hypothetical protein [Vibrio]|uniref:hypothetical protein n=1 Tax=Vibrio TaxID=662 RepID=UPI0022AF9024|nr:hypothetical protein [Vibrio atlanticus]MCZ4310104.1 hypothetical protein [Vibrio atlanticus]